MLPEVLVAVIACPNCAGGMEGTWAVPEDVYDEVEPCLQECPSCATRFTADYPGFAFKAEA